SCRRGRLGSCAVVATAVTSGRVAGGAECDDGAKPRSKFPVLENVDQLYLHRGIVAQRRHVPSVIARRVVAARVETGEVLAQVADIVDGGVQEIVAADAASRMECRHREAVLGTGREGTSRLGIVMHAWESTSHDPGQAGDDRGQARGQVTAIGILRGKGGG